MVENVRLSLGTAIQLGLETGKSNPDFTTAFLMTYHPGKCIANCAFCPQARESVSNSDRLSRIGWPLYSFASVLESMGRKKQFKRVCIQCLNYPRVVSDVFDIITAVKSKISVPVSVCIHPVSREEMIALQRAGIERIGIAFDACTPPLFSKIKGTERKAPYQWGLHLTAIETAQRIFGEENVTTHLIIGLGESEREAVEFVLNMYDRGLTVGLFAFTPIKGTMLEDFSQPDLNVYRRIQAVRYLRHKRLIERSQVTFTQDGVTRINLDSERLLSHLMSGEAFRTSGCPHCNRPYYNERPSGPMYNYPRRLSEGEAVTALQESELIRHD